MNGGVRARVRKANQENAATTSVRTISVRILVSVVIMLMLSRPIRSGFKLATDPARYVMYLDWGFYIGILTMLFGFFFLILGLPILADLFLNLSEQTQEEAGIHKAKEMKTIGKVIIRILITVTTMIMLWWAIYTGFRLATEPRRGNRNHLLTVSLGVVTILFGFIYFIIGLAIITELGMDLLGHLQQKGKRGSRNSLRLKH